MCRTHSHAGKSPRGLLPIRGALWAGGMGSSKQPAYATGALRCVALRCTHQRQGGGAGGGQYPREIWDGVDVLLYYTCARAFGI